MNAAYKASKERLALISAAIRDPDAYTEAWSAPHATIAGIRTVWPALTDYDARAYAISLGLASRPGRIVAVETFEVAATPTEPLTIPQASLDKLVDTLAEAVADKVYDLLEEKLSRKARRGLFGTGR